jgi:exodeoxyribonuclease VII large subunit
MQQDAESARVCQSVSQLNRAVSGALQREFGVQRVRGELAALTRAASGHWYFVLKDATAQVRCVMFRGRNAQLDWVPREGDEVEVLAAVALYEARGEFQLTVETLRRFGAGRLWEQFQRLRQQLAAEGLFDAAIKRVPPPIPRRVGVVTSLQAAALRDVLTTLRRRAPYVEVIVYPVPVQGADAGARIAQMLQSASLRAEVDVLLLVRGGGSIEDLWAFNEEQVARAIRASALPVIVGVGHESDFTIADFAADVRAPTPTAAAEMAAPDRVALLRELASRRRALARASARLLSERIQRVDYAVRALASPRAPLRGLQTRIGDLRMRAGHAARAAGRRAGSELAGLLRALPRAHADPSVIQRTVRELVRRMLDAQQRSARDRAARLASLERGLAQLDVRGVLERGFAILRDGQGRVITDAGLLITGAAVHASLARGAAELRVERAHTDAAEEQDARLRPPGA